MKYKKGEAELYIGGKKIEFVKMEFNVGHPIQLVKNIYTSILFLLKRW